MNDGWFTKEQTGFWGSIALVVAAYFKYKTASLKQKEYEMTEGTNTQELGTENIEKVLGGVNAVGEEVAKLAKDGIQVKDAETLVEDILTGPDLRKHITDVVTCMKAAIAEGKNINVVEGIAVVKFEYDGVKKIIDIIKS